MSRKGGGSSAALVKIREEFGFFPSLINHFRPHTLCEPACCNMVLQVQYVSLIESFSPTIMYVDRIGPAAQFHRKLFDLSPTSWPAQMLVRRLA